MPGWLSHADAPDATDRPLEISAQDFAQLRGALIKALRVSAEAREPLCDALEIVESIQQKLDRATPPAEAVRPERRRAKSQQYEIQETPEGPFLTERRPGESQPFRCPRSTYDAAARVLADASEAMHFDELMERLTSALRERQPDYRLRVSLRFWIHQRLVARFRTRYRAVERETFPDLARRAWESLSASAPRSRVA